jgi:hypothetical protein
MAKDFPAQFAPSVLKITPVSPDGTSGQPWTQSVYVFSIPNWLTVGTRQIGEIPSVTVGSHDVTFGWELPIPDKPITAARVTFPDWVPYFGGQEFGLKDTSFMLDGSVKSSGAGSGSVTGTTGFTAFGSALDGTVGGSAAFSLGPPDGFKLQNAAVRLGISGTLNSGEVPLLKVIPGIGELAAVLPDSFTNFATLDAKSHRAWTQPSGFLNSRMARWRSTEQPLRSVLV